MHRDNSHLLLVNPWIFDFASYDFWLKPLGLLSIAAVLRLNGFRVTLIDCLDRHHPLMTSMPDIKRLRNSEIYGHGQFFKEKVIKPPCLTAVPRHYSRYGIHPDIFIQELNKLSPPPSAILITTLMTYWYPGAALVIDLVRKAFPDTPVILGGNYVTLCPDHAATLNADYYIKGYGERQALTLLGKITSQEITFLPEEGNMDKLPYPAFDLLNEHNYVCIQTSRGCPFQCSYCASNLLNSGFKRSSPERIADEIEHWVKGKGIRNIVFYDDALLYESEGHIIPILKHIIKKRIKDVFFHTPNGLHARFMNADLAGIMFKSGFKDIRLGYETSDIQRQKTSGGKVNDGDLEAALAYLKEAGFSQSELGVYIMIGLPGQEYGEVEESVKKVIVLGAVPILTEFSPIPGTTIWNDALRSSRYDLENDPVFHNNSIFPCEWAGFSWKDYLRIKSMVSERRRINRLTNMEL
ncbi:radical SAM protein [bacterium]|nr:radical SAM protein [bacterium]